MTIEEFRNKVIEEGIASIKKYETKPSHIKGGLAGFELCRTLNSIWDYEDCLAKRHQEEDRMYHDALDSKASWPESPADIEAYWEHRYATLQVEHVFECLKVIWAEMGLYSGPLSSKAIIQATRIVIAA